MEQGTSPRGLSFPTPHSPHSLIQRRRSPAVPANVPTLELQEYTTMAKKVVGYIKLQVKAGQANPSPPVGPELGQRGLTRLAFCNAFTAPNQQLEPGLPKSPNR